MLWHRPGARAGKKVNPPTIATVPISSPTNWGPSVGNVPAPAGMMRLAAGSSEMHSAGRKTRDRPANIASASVRLKNGELAFDPANALPSVAAPEV